jgi:hypothetical protein
MLQWLECSPATIWFRQGWAKPPRCAFWEGGSKPPSLSEVIWNSAVKSPIMTRSGDGGSLRVEPMTAASELSLLGERLKPLKQSTMNSRLPKQIVSLRENPSHVKHSPSVETVIVDEGTIRMSRGKERCKSRFLTCQLSVFFAPARTG